MRAGQNLIQRIFGAKDLVGNFDLANAVKYNQFCRIDKQIRFKNKRVVSLMNQNILNSAISMVMPFYFWLKLEPTDATLIASRYLAYIKLA